MSAYSNLQRNQVRGLLAALRREQDESARWLYNQILSSEAVGRYREKNPVFAQPKDHVITENRVSEFVRGRTKPRDDTMALFVEFLVDAGALKKAYFYRLGSMDFTASTPMSDRMRARLFAFPHDASYAQDYLERGGITVRVLHLKKTQTTKQAVAYQTSVYLRRLNESDTFLTRRAEEGFRDSRSESLGELAWTGDFYQLKLGASRIEPANRTYALPRLAHCVLHEDEHGHHSLDVMFWEPAERFKLIRCTPLHKEVEPPNLTKMIRINMMRARKRFLLEREPLDEPPTATKEDAGSETSVEDQQDLNNELIEAARVGDARTMAVALINGADINAKEVGGRGASVLHMVAQARSCFALDVVLFNAKSHQEMIEDLTNLGVTDLNAADQAIRRAQKRLDAAVVDNEYFFPSEYVQDVGPPESEKDILTKHQNFLYATLMALEDTHLVRKGMPHGLSFGYDPEARAKFFDIPSDASAAPLPPEV